MLTDEQKFVLSRSALLYKDVQSFVIKRAPNSFEKLRHAPVQFHLSCCRFRKVNDSSTYDSNQDLKSDVSQFETRNTAKPEHGIKTSTSEELGAPLAELSLIVVKQENIGGSGSRDIRISRADYRFAEKTSEFCQKNGHSIDDCWKNERERMFCSLCRNRGHDVAPGWFREVHDQYWNAEER